MREIGDVEVLARLKLDNPWWSGAGIRPELRKMQRRDYFPSLLELVSKPTLRRAVVLMGPRRVGKTTLIQHLIQALLDSGVPGSHILYAPLDAPALTGLGLEELVDLLGEAVTGGEGEIYVFFDEVQYLKAWEQHLKSLYDSRPRVRALVSGSAAAALRQKSVESGAGRFTDYLLPPLTFAEFIKLSSYRGLLPGGVSADLSDGPNQFFAPDISKLNDAFEDYVNYGGFPEIAVQPIGDDAQRRYVGSDIVERALQGDLPSLYGISDVRELTRLFNVIAYNTAQEFSLERLSQSSGLAKNTISRYLDYLEAAFLIKRLERIDHNARRFERATAFKIHLTNTSMRAALFGPVARDDERFGSLVETAISAQLFHMPALNIAYARWPKGEVDLVFINNATQKPTALLEVKWSDGAVDRREDWDGISYLAGRHASARSWMRVTTRTRRQSGSFGGAAGAFIPAAYICLWFGARAVALRTDDFLRSLSGTDDPRT